MCFFDLHTLKVVKIIYFTLSYQHMDYLNIDSVYLKIDKQMIVNIRINGFIHDFHSTKHMNHDSICTHLKWTI